MMELNEIQENKLTKTLSKTQMIFTARILAKKATQPLINDKWSVTKQAVSHNQLLP